MISWNETSFLTPQITSFCSTSCYAIAPSIQGLYIFLMGEKLKGQENSQKPPTRLESRNLFCRINWYLFYSQMYYLGSSSLTSTVSSLTSLSTSSLSPSFKHLETTSSSLLSPSMKHLETSSSSLLSPSRLVDSSRDKVIRKSANHNGPVVSKISSCVHTHRQTSCNLI